jgi:hypothetical protein
MKKLLFFLLLAAMAGGVNAQLPFPFPKQAPAKTDEGDRLDSLLNLLHKKRSRVRSYESVVTRDAIAYPGIFTVHKVRDSFFFEIPDTLLLRDLQLITRLVKGSTVKDITDEGGPYPGEALDQKTIYFKPGPDSTLFLYSDLEATQADPNSRISIAVKNANSDPLLQAFPIIAFGKDHRSFVIDATPLLKGSSFLTNVGNKRKPGAVPASITPTATKGYYVDYIHAYPLNVEIGIYKMTDQNPIVFNASFIALPKIPMQQRLADRRVGFIADYVYYFSDDQQKVEKRQFINRWRLEPRAEDRARWERGELVEPANPIVIYIDPNTPKQWRKYLILGVDDWQKAFEQAGFKNAIMGREWPYGDSANLDDARYSFIRYLPSAKANAYGPNVHDPRSGEIIQTHIAWYHNVMSLVHNWYLIQAAATDPRARHAKFDDDLMGQLIRFVCSHEVGHTLGLLHNFGSSSRTPVEKMRDKAWLDVHGHTASIMDYARFDYVAQPEDHIPEEDLWPRVGEYDRWAIQWGYRYSGASDAEADKKIVDKWITDSLAGNPRLWFGSQEEDDSPPSDPRCQTEDLGDNNMTANAYGIRNLKRILPNLPAWCRESGGQYESLQEAYRSLLNQFRQYMSHVLTNVGGVERTYRSEEATGDVYAPTPKARQQQALAFFNEELFTTPTWLLDPAVVSKVTSPEDPDVAGDLQVRVLNSLLDTATFSKLAANTSRFGPAASYSQDEFLSTLHKYIWGVLATGRPMDVYRRNLQKSYVGALSDILVSINPNVTETDAYSLARADLLRVQKEINAALPRYAGMDRAHLESELAVIKKLTTVKTD